MLVLISTWRLASSVMAQTRDLADLTWARDLAAMIKASMAGHVVGGLVIAHAYYEPFYVLVALLTILKGMVQRQKSGVAAQPFGLAAAVRAAARDRRSWTHGAQ
jgi:hypothetical protein